MILEKKSALESSALPTILDSITRLHQTKFALQIFYQLSRALTSCFLSLVNLKITNYLCLNSLINNEDE
ncbi:unnamed protein product [Rotaria socialis]